MEAAARLGPIASPPKFQLGDLTVRVLDGGSLWLDGGAMFGIIPKPIWSQRVEVDAQNRIPLATTCLFVETAGKRILIETGCGERLKYSEKEHGFFSFGHNWLLPSLEAAGIDRQTIDLVILTHLHFDHAGGATMSDSRGGFMPTFPRAKYVVQRGEWQDAIDGHAVMTGTYRRENLEPLERAGVLALADGDAEIAPGIRVRVLAGHTRHQQGVVLCGGGETIVQPADLMPTSAHVGLRFNMSYDLLPFENMVNKGNLLKEAEAGRWKLLLGQDPRHALWRIETDSGGRHVLRASVD